LIYACPATARLATLKTALELPIPAVAGLVLQEPEPAPELAPATPAEEQPAAAGSDIAAAAEKAEAGEDKGPVEQLAAPADAEDKPQAESADKVEKDGKGK